MEWSLFKGSETIEMVVGKFHPSNDDIILFKPVEGVSNSDLAQRIISSQELTNALRNRWWSFVIKFNNNIYAVKGNRTVMDAFGTAIQGTKQKLLEEFEDGDDDLGYILSSIEKNTIGKSSVLKRELFHETVIMS